MLPNVVAKESENRSTADQALEIDHISKCYGDTMALRDLSFSIRVRSRVFRIGTALIVLLLICYVVLQTRVLNTRTTVTSVGFTGPALVLAQPLKEAAHGLGRVTIQHVASQAVGESLVRSGNLDVLVSGSPLSPQALVKNHRIAQEYAAGMSGPKLAKKYGVGSTRTIYLILQKCQHEQAPR